MANAKYLRNKVTGVVFLSTEKLVTMDTMESCNEDGSPYVPFVEEIEAEEPKSVVEAATTDPVLNNVPSVGESNISAEPAPSVE